VSEITEKTKWTDRRLQPLRNENMFLDKSRISVDKLEDPRLKADEKLVLELMQSPSHRLLACLHEATHGYYLERAGAKRLIYHGPTASYDAESDTFDIGKAAIQPDFGGQPVKVEIETMARWLVAGGVAVNLLTGWDDEGGDGQDFEWFVRKCLTGSPEMKQEVISAFWEQAKKEVAKDLRSPALRRELWRRARVFEEFLLRDGSLPPSGKPLQ
jgi:hypothetical protein